MTYIKKKISKFQKLIEKMNVERQKIQPKYNFIFYKITRTRYLLHRKLLKNACIFVYTENS